MKRKTQKRRLFNKKAGASVGTAIKVLTSVVLGAAMLAGTYGVVKTTVVPTTENKVSSMFEVTDAVELNGGGAGGVVVPDPVVEIKRNGVIPEGGTYCQNTGSCGGCGEFTGISGMTCPVCGYAFEEAGTLLTAGENFPETPLASDIYIEGDYIYDCWGASGWNVRAKENKSSYGEIITEIAGITVNSMSGTFRECTNITTAPLIPSSVTNMHETFSGCTSLVTMPTIPSSVTNMYYTFNGCTSLTTATTIPSSVTSLPGTFAGCTSLNTVVIPNSVTDMTETFMGCTSLSTAPTIPSGVTAMVYTFGNCSSLIAAPIIPDSVTDMFMTFLGCTSLTGTIEVNANPTSYDDCLGSTQITGITGSCSQETKDALMATK